ncbi:family 20 glycosylhydrolase [Granulicella sp. dw_53]|uniref:family 20 glycosylhydrolase n=1 Tax=Granulicella sp. dw_53 TaxID=2719792 RepID=UPI001BD22D58|nr:family 20 glycosylhydrolase [Granulicella sp. dw_53]
MNFIRSGAILLFLTKLASPFAPAQTALPHSLIPVPRELRLSASQSLAAGLQISCAAPCAPEDAFAIEDLKTYLTSQNISVNTTSPVNILVTRYGSANSKAIYSDSLATPNPSEAMPDAMKPEGYSIIPDGRGLALTAASASGIFYALQTVKQLIDITPGTAANSPVPILHTATIRDWPAMKYRGLHDDLSRGPFPTLDFQKKLIRTLAAYKVNVYSPYFEHTMQYTGHPLMAPPGGTLTQAQARELVAYATQYHVTIIPEQEAFGHLHYLLNWEQYTPLAETPHGHVLAPAQPDAQKLTHDMFTELAAIYPSPMLHLGADETVELGKGQTKPAVDAQGLGPVYLGFMQRIVADLQPLHRKLLFWGDIAYKEPDLLKAMPDSFKQATIAVAWEYNPQPRGFNRFITPFTDAKMETWVAPGVNNWSRVYPNWNNALSNIQQFTAQGQALGVQGQLNTLWYDDGEALANNNWYGILFGAEAAWHQGEASIPAFQSSYGSVFHGDVTGKLDEAQRELMVAHKLLKDSPYKTDGQDLLYWQDPWNADGQRTASQIRPILSELRLHAERALTLIAQARDAAAASNTPLREIDAVDAMELGARRMDLIGLKFQLTDEMATSYAHAFSLQSSKKKEDREDLSLELNDINGVNGKLQDMRNNYSLLRDLYETAWLKSNRPYFLRNVLERYDYTIQLWISRSDKLRTAQRQWANSQSLPAAADLGIPAPPQTAQR